MENQFITAAFSIYRNKKKSLVFLGRSSGAYNSGNSTFEKQKLDSLVVMEKVGVDLSASLT